MQIGTKNCRNRVSFLFIYRNTIGEFSIAQQMQMKVNHEDKTGNNITIFKTCEISFRMEYLRSVVVKL